MPACKHTHRRASFGVTDVRSVLMTDWQCTWWWLLVYWVLNVEGGGLLVRRPLKAHSHVNVIVKVDLAWSWPPQSPDIFTFLMILPVDIFLRTVPKFLKAPIIIVMPVRTENVTRTGYGFLKLYVQGCDCQQLISTPTYVLCCWQRNM